MMRNERVAEYSLALWHLGVAEPYTVNDLRDANAT
jgi:hypothetical protein